MAAVMSKERFESTPTFAEYQAGMQANKERMAQFVDEVVISAADLDWWQGRGPLKVYTLTFDACGDALFNIPVLAKIAQQAPNVDLRVAQRDENLDIMDRYLNEGLYRSAPTFIILDENLEEIGSLKERPADITRIIEAEMLGIRRSQREINKAAWRPVVAEALKAVAGGATGAVPVGMTPERFAAATTFAQYHALMKANQERMGQFVDEVEISAADLAWWRDRGPLKIYTLTYDSCGDALYNIPVLAKIAQEAPNVDLRVVQRDEHLDMMDQFRNQSLYRSVPTFIVMDERLREIGNLKERPDAITRILEAEQLTVRRRLREENKVAWRGMVADALKAAAGGA